MNRRKFIKNSLLAGIGTSIGLGYYAWQVEPFWLEFVQKKMHIPQLPSEHEGKLLMQISDIHVGNRFDYQYLIDSFEKAKQYKPDFVVYTGDYVSYENELQFEQLREVMKHVVTGKEATYGILGNHDWGRKWSQPEVAEEINNILINSGITMLRNSQDEYKGINFIGFDDYWSPNFKPKETMQNWNPNQANIVLCHNPDACDLDVWNGYNGWILAGHTHGGQCKPPFLDAPLIPIKNSDYIQGQVALEDGRTLYVNRALGHRFQVRFLVRPEITLFTLTSQKA